MPENAPLRSPAIAVDVGPLHLLVLVRVFRRRAASRPRCRVVPDVAVAESMYSSVPPSPRVTVTVTVNTSR